MAAAKPQSRARKRGGGVEAFAEDVVEPEEDQTEESDEEESDDESDESEEEIIEEDEEAEELEEAEEEPQAKEDFAPFIFSGEERTWSLEDIFSEVIDRGFAVIYDTSQEGLSAGVQWFKVTPVRVGEIQPEPEGES